MGIKFSVVKKWSKPVWWDEARPRFYEPSIPVEKGQRSKRIKVSNPRFGFHLEAYLKRVQIKHDYAAGLIKRRYPPKEPFKPKLWKREWAKVPIFSLRRRKPLKLLSPRALRPYKFFKRWKRRAYVRHFSKKFRKVVYTRYVVRIIPDVNNVFLNISYNDKYIAHRKYSNYKAQGKKKMRIKKFDPRYGRTLTMISTGRVGFKGPRRSSYIAAEEVGRRAAKELKRRKIKKVQVILFSVKNKKTKAAVRGLLDKRLKIKASNYKLCPPIPHSKGLRKKKPRRV